MKENKTIFSIHRHLTDPDYKKQKAIMKTCTVKSMEQVKQEIKAYGDYWQVPADDYIRYGLFAKELPMEEILDYIPKQVFYCKFLANSYKGIDTKKYDDKLLQDKILKSLNIQTPETLGYCKKCVLKRLDESALTYDDMLAATVEGERIFFKPTDGAGGYGIIVLTHVGDKFTMKGMVVDTFEKMGLNKNATYLIQRGIKQDKEISKIYGDCINTLRVIAQYRNGKTHLIACIMRIGRNGAEVDNSAQGGLSLKINLEDGSFITPAITEHGGELFDVHPDTGYVFKGNGLHNWRERKQEIINIVSKLSKYNDLGWDIALTETGIQVIEFNFGYGIEHLQNCNGGMRRTLNVYP